MLKHFLLFFMTTINVHLNYAYIQQDIQLYVIYTKIIQNTNLKHSKIFTEHLSDIGTKYASLKNIIF